MSQDARVWCVSLSAGGLHSDISVTGGKKSQNKTPGTKQMGLSVGGLLPGMCSRPTCARLYKKKNPNKTTTTTTKIQDDRITHLTTWCPSGRHAVIMWLFYSNSSSL